MKDLPVRFRADNNCYCINASRVGRSDKYGSFATRDEALAEAEMLKARFLTGMIAQPLQISKCADAAAAFLESQTRRVDDEEISLSHFKAVKRSIDFSLAIRIDGKMFGKHALDKLVTKANKDELAATFKREIKAEGKSKSLAEQRIKALKSFFNYCQAKGWVDLNPLDKVSFGLATDIADRAPKIQPETVKQLVTQGLTGETLIKDDAYRK